MWGRSPSQCLSPLSPSTSLFLSSLVKEVQQKYEAMLQMYGEKAEETEELKLDIQDLKTLYRQQVSSRNYNRNYT